MSNIGHGKKYEIIKGKLLNASLKLFLKNGFQATKISDITSMAKVDGNAVARVFGDKETLVAELVDHILTAQFEMANSLAKEKENELFAYMTETVLQLYMAESSEEMREIYNMAYTGSKSSSIIYEVITRKLEDLLNEYLPHYDAKDFYELEIASGGIMRSFIAVPCDRYFTMERKVNKYLDYILLLFKVPEQKVQELKEFVLQFDYPSIVAQVVEKILEPF
jgi:AcrR family transcriptional regulator